MSRVKAILTHCLRAPRGTGSSVPDPDDADGIDSFNTEGMSPDEVAQVKEDWGKWQDSNQHSFAETIAASVLNGFDRGAR